MTKVTTSKERVKGETPVEQLNKFSEFLYILYISSSSILHHRPMPFICHVVKLLMY